MTVANITIETALVELAPAMEDITVVVADETVVLELQGLTGDTGLTGPAGPVGPMGPAGSGGAGGGGFVHVQSVPLAVWVIGHALGFVPAGVVVVDSGGANVEGSISYPDGDTVQIDFSAAFSGIAYLS